MEPGFRCCPIALDGGMGDAKRFRDFVDVQAGEELQFDDLDEARIKQRERSERFVQREHIDAGTLRRLEALGEGQHRCTRAALVRVFLARVIDENLPHRARGEGKKMTSTLRCRTGGPHQTQVRFIDKSRGLECVAGTLVAQVRARHAAQFAVDDREQPIERIRNAAAPVVEKRGDLLIRLAVGHTGAQQD